MRLARYISAKTSEASERSVQSFSHATVLTPCRRAERRLLRSSSIRRVASRETSTPRVRRRWLRAESMWFSFPSRTAPMVQTVKRIAQRTTAPTYPSRSRSRRCREWGSLSQRRGQMLLPALAEWRSSARRRWRQRREHRAPSLRAQSGGRRAAPSARAQICLHLTCWEISSTLLRQGAKGYCTISLPCARWWGSGRSRRSRASPRHWRCARPPLPP